MTELFDRFLHAWYSNLPIEFGISGTDIVSFGGPDPSFSCPICQKSEWLSRIKQSNLFAEHRCSTATRCLELCSKQGNDTWTNLHRNHFFSVGYDSNLSCAKILFFVSKEKTARLWQIFHTRTCEYHMHNLRAQLAISGQVTISDQLEKHEWENYDFLFMMNTGATTPIVARPPIPIVMYCHDMWTGGFQEVLNHYQPSYVLTPYPTAWNRRFQISGKVWFYPLLAGTFYTRPNITQKRVDLLVTGTMNSAKYDPRKEYNKQLNTLPSKYKVEHSHLIGCKSNKHIGSVVQSGNVRYMNKWSEYLGEAKFVTFGPCSPPWASEFLLMKFGEYLGSGAIPIIPEPIDLALLGVRPMVHYIPLKNVWKNNSVLREYLDHYDKYKHIAENAVNWYRDHADNLIYSNFEDLVQEITDGKYPRRLVC